MKKLLKINTWNIRTRLMFFFLFFAIVPLILVGSISFYISYIDAQKKINEYSTNITSQISQNIGNYIKQYNQKIIDIAFSGELQDVYPQIIKLDEKGSQSIFKPH